MTANLRPTFILFGDSLTQQSFSYGGWGSLLQNVYARKADVILRGYSGYNSRWALHLLDAIFPKDSDSAAPALVTIFFGANDAALPGRQSERQHVPVAEYKKNLTQIVQHIQSLPASTKIILLTPPPVDEAARATYARATYGENAATLPERENTVTKFYADACLEVSRETNVASIDLWTIVQQKSDWKQLLSDGLHFTPEGNSVVFNEVVRVIEQSKWEPSLVADELQNDFPWHGDIDHLNPQNSF